MRCSFTAISNFSRGLLFFSYPRKTRQSFRSCRCRSARSGCRRSCTGPRHLRTRIRAGCRNRTRTRRHRTRTRALFRSQTVRNRRCGCRSRRRGRTGCRNPCRVRRPPGSGPKSCSLRSEPGRRSRRWESQTRSAVMLAAPGRRLFVILFVFGSIVAAVVVAATILGTTGRSLIVASRRWPVVISVAIAWV